MASVRGRFLSPSGQSYTNHRVYLSFREPAQDVLELSENAFVSVLKSAPVDPEGTFSLEIPDSSAPPFVLELRSPDGRVLFRREFSSLEELTDFEAEVEPAVPPDIPPHPDRFRGKRVKLRGRVIAQEGAVDTCGLQVMIWARGEGEEDFRIVFTSVTTSGGYFTGDVPRERYEEAYLQVAEVPEHRVPLRLEEGFLPLRIVVVVPLSGIEHDFRGRGNGCAPDSRPVLDPIDLAEPLASVSREGGGCVEFNVPNRVIEEFSFYKVVRTTDPQIKGSSPSPDGSLPRPVERFIRDLLTKSERMREFVWEGFSLRTSTTAPLVLMNPRSPRTNAEILKDVELNVDSSFISEVLADPDLFTPRELMTASRYRAFMKLKDIYDIFRKKTPARGELDADNPVDWDETPTFYQATTIAHGHILHFKQIWRADGYSLGDLLYSLPLAPCQKKRIAIVDWERREMAARTELDTAEERLLASLNRDRDVSEMVRVSVSEMMRAGSESEVESWAAGGGLGFGMDGFFIGVGGGGGGGYAESRAWQEASRNLTSSTLQRLRDSIVQAASAVRSRRSTVVQTVRQGETVQLQTEVVANHNHCHAITIQYFEVLRHFLVSHELVDVQECLFIPLQMTPFTADKALRWREALRRFLRDRSLERGFDALERIRTGYEDSDFPTGTYADDNIEHIDGELFVEFVIARPRDQEEDERFSDYIENAWGWWWFLGGNVGDVYRRYLKDQRDKERVFREQIAPRLAEKFVQNLKFHLILSDGREEPVDLDPTLVSDYEEGAPLYVKLNSTGSIPSVRRRDIAGVRISTEYTLPPNSKVIVRSAFLRYRTKYLNHKLYRNRRVNDDLIRVEGDTTTGDSVFLSTPLDRIELRNPRKEDREMARRLLRHLNHNIEYYHRVLWLSMDPNRRYMLLDGFVAPNSGGRSVASVVENRVIAIVGNCLVMPVAPGFKLDPTYRGKSAEELLDAYAPTIPPPPVRVAVPTRGVFAESVMGSCNSCEEKDETRFWRWEESPCPDQPPAIAEVSAESRRETPPDMKTQGFPQPIISIQNVPAAPSPTNLAAVLENLLESDVFRDITGLTETQKNALKAFLESLGMAESLGGEALKNAAKIALQKSMERNVDKALQIIQQAKKAGLIGDEEARELTRSAISTFIGGGGEKEEETQENSPASEGSGGDSSSE